MCKPEPAVKRIQLKWVQLTAEARDAQKVELDSQVDYFSKSETKNFRKHI